MTVVLVAVAGLAAGLSIGLLVRRGRLRDLAENVEWTGEDLQDRKRLDLVRDLYEHRSLKDPEPPPFMRLDRDLWGVRS